MDMPLLIVYIVYNRYWYL